jgi:hypothetical protein
MKLPRRQFLHLAASAAALPARSIVGARMLTKNHFRRRLEPRNFGSQSSGANPLHWRTL